MRYAVADVANPPLFRKGLVQFPAYPKRAVLLLTFGAVPIMARFFQILPPRSASPASSVGGHYWRQMLPEFMQSADSSLQSYSELTAGLGPALRTTVQENMFA